MIVRLGAIEFKLFPVRSTYALVAIYLIASALCSLSILPNLHNAHVPVISVVDVLRPLHRQQLDDSRPPQPSQALEEHSYTPDGLLVVNPHGPHPIFELMRKAEEDWNKKLSRASTTLDEAVTEYRRRYKRRPPLGFDKWWDYVVKHGIQLPDEYDEIFYDLEAYWGLDPEDLARAHDELENGYEVITVAKEPSSSMFEFVQSTVSGNLAEHFRRIRNILDLITEVEHELPPMRITFSPHDNPSMLSDWVIKNMTMEAAKSGTSAPFFFFTASVERS
ncbi:hypothetical protein ID866_1910 [Astraeus odoratus]|nr:hypothetical protein ID866_1910 [Astraeus odoratus]